MEPTCREPQLRSHRHSIATQWFYVHNGSTYTMIIQSSCEVRSALVRTNRWRRHAAVASVAFVSCRGRRVHLTGRRSPDAILTRLMPISREARLGQCSVLSVRERCGVLRNRLSRQITYTQIHTPRIQSKPSARGFTGSSVRLVCGPDVAVHRNVNSRNEAGVNRLASCATSSLNTIVYEHKDRATPPPSVGIHRGISRICCHGDAWE